LDYAAWNWLGLEERKGALAKRICENVRRSESLGQATDIPKDFYTFPTHNQANFHLETIGCTLTL
jgi:hypothetical protein